MDQITLLIRVNSVCSVTLSLANAKPAGLKVLHFQVLHFSRICRPIP